MHMSRYWWYAGSAFSSRMTSKVFERTERFLLTMNLYDASNRRPSTLGRLRVRVRVRVRV